VIEWIDGSSRSGRCCLVDEKFAWSLAALAAAAFDCCLRWQLRLIRACKMLIQV
jgi:hypothetical protein